MTKKEIVNRNIGLNFDFVKGLIEHSSLIKNIPNHCEVEFVEKNFPLKHEKNLKDKYIIKVKSVFETITKVAEPQAKYKRKN